MTQTIDKIAPKLVSAIPKTGSNAVKVNANVVLTFNETVKAGSTGNITISDGTDIHKIAITDPQVHITGKKITLNPSSNLDPNSHYSVTIDSTAIKDVAGNKYAGISNKTTLSFDTVDTIPPTLISSSPKDDSTAVKVNSNVVLTFSEPVKAGTVGNITISDTSNGGTDVNKIPVTDNSQVKIKGSTVTVNPTDNLDPNGHYDVTVSSVAIKDLQGNKFAGIKDDTTLNFDTADNVAPTLDASTSDTLGTPLHLDDNIVLTFNEAVKIGTGNLILSDGSHTRSIAITDKSQITVDGKNVILNPTDNLDPNAHYSIQIAATAIKDLAGNKFAGIQDKTTLSFETTDTLASLTDTNTPPVTPSTVSTNTAPAVYTETSGDDVINANQGSVYGNPIQFNAANGNDSYVINANIVNNSVTGANINISGFGTGDKLVFDVATPASGFAEVDALYSVSDDGRDVTLLVNYGDVQSITLTGITGAGVGGTIESVTELAKFLGTDSINFV